MLIVGDYEALQGIRDSGNLSPIQQCIIKGPVMKDMADILGEEGGIKEGGAVGPSASRSTLVSRRSSLNPVPANGNKNTLKNVFTVIPCRQFHNMFLGFFFQNVDILPEVWALVIQFVKSECEYVPVDVPELQL